MGRWAQRRRGRGGGGPSPAPTIDILQANADPADDFTIITYSADITAGDFTPADFKSNGSDQLGTSISQVASDSISVTFPGLIGLDTGVTYSGHTPSILTPQTVAYT